MVGGGRVEHGDGHLVRRSPAVAVVHGQSDRVGSQPEGDRGGDTRRGPEGSAPGVGEGVAVRIARAGAVQGDRCLTGGAGEDGLILSGVSDRRLIASHHLLGPGEFRGVSGAVRGRGGDHVAGRHRDRHQDAEIAEAGAVRGHRERGQEDLSLPRSRGVCRGAREQLDGVGRVRRAVQEALDDRGGAGALGAGDLREVLPQVASRVAVAVVVGRRRERRLARRERRRQDVDAEAAIRMDRIFRDMVSLVAVRRQGDAEAEIRRVEDAVRPVPRDDVSLDEIARRAGAVEADPLAAIAQSRGARAVGTDPIVHNVRPIRIAQADPVELVPGNQIVPDDVAGGLGER